MIAGIVKEQSYRSYLDHPYTEFVVGDLRDVNFVERVIQYKGDRGNFYNFVPSRYLQSFDEIYQFAYRFYRYRYQTDRYVRH